MSIFGEMQDYRGIDQPTNRGMYNAERWQYDSEEKEENWHNDVLNTHNSMCSGDKLERVKSKIIEEGYKLYTKTQETAM